eukprot:scaffold109821_cov63-Phaeocystis_antarctica.AAC.2
MCLDASKTTKYLEDALEVGHQSHLLVELRRLREVGLAPEVLDGEDVRPPLGGGAHELGRVDLREALREQELAEELAHAVLHAEDALVGRRAQVDDAVVQPHVLVDSHRARRRVGGRQVVVVAAGVLELQRQLAHRAAHHEEPLHLQPRCDAP